MRTEMMRSLTATLLFVPAFVSFVASSAKADITKAVQDACAADYHKYCDDYGLESAALRMCMDKAGHSLSKACVQALIQAGEVTRAEVDERKKSGR